MNFKILPGYLFTLYVWQILGSIRILDSLKLCHSFLLKLLTFSSSCPSYPIFYWIICNSLMMPDYFIPESPAQAAHSPRGCLAHERWLVFDNPVSRWDLTSNLDLPTFFFLTLALLHSHHGICDTFSGVYFVYSY